MRPLVLTYHGFGVRTVEEDPYNMFVPIDTFTNQLDHLLKNGWTPLDVSAYLACLEGWPTPKRSFLITIDDGYISTLEVGELLAARGVSALLFVPPGLLGGTSKAWAPEMTIAEPLLDADGLRAAVALGFDVGAHGWDHAPMIGMDADDLRHNTVDAKEVLDELLGVRPRAFAYPKGRFDDASRRAVEEAGYAVGFSVEHNAGLFAMPRVDVNATDTPRTFAMKCARWWPAARAAGRQFPTVRKGLHRILGSARTSARTPPQSSKP